MFPTQLELEVLHAERVRAAEHSRMLRAIGGPSLFERIRARLSAFNASVPATPEPAPVRQPARCDAAVTSQ